MNRKKLKPASWPEIIRVIGARTIAQELGVDKSLPYIWEGGQRPKVDNAQKLVALAEKKGYELKLEQVLGGAQ